ncbi:hypothetical protein FHU38_004909 [Saccharomonospora amisosensis]|uniref:Uncharacterized protein n=1 Tax=Saccharomonospora amisosensis TaxID=1128677 RepID=A0A7X5UUN1_9PSEU|nr:hypothetical protein [Saccharomonospora amisosensis]
MPQLVETRQLVVNGKNEQLSCFIVSTHSETHPAL